MGMFVRDSFIDRGFNETGTKHSNYRRTPVTKGTGNKETQIAS
jgi:hypothetical protein